MSHPTEDDWKRILKMVESIASRPDAEPFREPVPWKALGLTDYPTIIKTPMDLGTIKSKVKKREYKTLYNVNEDVRIVWSNCMTYNADGSDFYKLAELLKKKWDEKYQKLLQEIGSGSDVNPDEPTGDSAADNQMSNKSSLADKRNFAKLLYTIDKVELGKILVDIEARHPAAIKRNATEDEVVLNIDEIPNPLLQELSNTISTNKGQNKKASSTSKSSNKKSKTT